MSEIMGMVTRAEHNRRVADLLEAGNRYLERARAAEARLKEVEADFKRKDEAWTKSLRIERDSLLTTTRLKERYKADRTDLLDTLREWLWAEIEKLPEGAASLPAFDHVLNQIDAIAKEGKR